MNKRLTMILILTFLLGIFTMIGATTISAGADRLVATQNTDGGWGWPLTGTSASNTIGPIAMGLAYANGYTPALAYHDALVKTGAYLLTKQYNFSPSDGYLAAALDEALGVTTYSAHVKTYFYNQLAAGTYNRANAGTLYSTSTYIDRIQTSRHGASQGNMAAWDIGLGLVGAASCGVTGSELDLWIAGVEDEINVLDGAAYYDVIGLAGALYGLAFVGEEFDPTAGEHAAASSLADLAAILASYQIAGGGFAWNSAYVIPNDGNETVQETAYAILALNEVNRTTYLTSITGAATYLANVQLVTGGWENYPTSGENNEITGEALWAYVIAQNPDITLPVVLSSFNAAFNATTESVSLSWVTQSESNLSGFYIYRNESNDLTGAIRVNSLITGTNTSTQHEYSYNDTNITPETTYWYWLNSVEMNGQINLYGPISVIIPATNPETPPIPVTLTTGLASAFPNPFESDLNVNYSLKKAGMVQLVVTNVKGQVIRNLLSAGKSEGMYTCQWDSKDNNGKACSSGVYFVRMTVDNKTYSKKVILAK